MRTVFLLSMIFASMLAFGQESATFLHHGKTYPRASENMMVVIKHQAELYSSPEYSDPSKQSSFFLKNWGQRCQPNLGSPDLSGRVLYKSGGMSAVQVDQNLNFCGVNFNSGAENRRVIFVKDDDIVKTYPAGDAVTEAKAPPPKCKDCEMVNSAESDIKNIMAALNEKGAKPEKPHCQKTPEEMEKYILCHAQAAQSNYDKYIKMAIDLAGDTFHADFVPKEKGPAVVTPILDVGAENPTGATKPFWIHADPKVMRCVVLRESQWDPAKVSGCQPNKPCPKGKNGKEIRGGGTGLGQQTNVNVKQVRCLVHGMCWEPLPVLDKKGNRVMVNGVYQYKKERGWVKKPPQEWAEKLFKSYLDRLYEKSTPEQKKFLFTNAKTGKPCVRAMEEKERDSFCPGNSIAALAVNSMDAAITMRNKSPLYKKDKIKDFGNDERCDFLTMQGAGNNAGIGTLGKSVEQARDVADWHKGIRQGTGDPGDHGLEAERFHEYIGNCLQAGNMDSMWPTPKGGKPDDCSIYSPMRPKPATKR